MAWWVRWAGGCRSHHHQCAVILASRATPTARPLDHGARCQCAKSVHGSSSRRESGGLPLSLMRGLRHRFHDAAQPLRPLTIPDFLHPVQHELRMQLRVHSTQRPYAQCSWPLLVAVQRGSCCCWTVKQRDLPCRSLLAKIVGSKRVQTANLFWGSPQPRLAGLSRRQQDQQAGLAPVLREAVPMGILMEAGPSLLL